MLNKSFIKNLLTKENDSITNVMAFMSYNPSIGRVLRKGGVKEFQAMMIEMVRELNNVKNIKDFDKLHNKYVKKIINNICTSKDSTTSYGQAQKPINVFLKVYIDWAWKPSKKMRDKLLPFLHVPLDSFVMKTLKKEDVNWYRKNITPLIKSKGQEFSLSKIDAKIYNRWQKYFRSNYPDRPLIFDVAWALNR